MLHRLNVASKSYSGWSKGCVCKGGFGLHGQVDEILSDKQDVCGFIDCKNYGHSHSFKYNFFTQSSAVEGSSLDDPTVHTIAIDQISK